MRRTLGLFLALWAACAAWALSTPPFAGPDEPAHVIRAAALWRGQLVGDDVPGEPRAYTRVEVPAFFLQGREVGCWAFRPDRTPNCVPPYERGGPVRATTTYVGRYFPLYYALVGLPTRVWPWEAGVYAARLLHAALVAVLLTGALACARRAPRPSFAVTGVAVATTPAALFFGGVVNPVGVEIAAAICLWAALPPLLGATARVPGPPPGPLGRRPDGAVVGWAATGAVFLATSRGLSLLWLALAVAAAAGVFGIDGVRGWRRSRALRGAAAAAGVASVAALVWLLAVGGLSLVPIGDRPTPGMPWPELIRLSIGKSEVQTLRAMVGLLQWADTRAPSYAYVVWLALAGLVVLLAAAAGTARTRAVLGALAVAVVALPVAIESSQARELGFVWAGRYGLPLAAGLPILAGWVLARSRFDLPRVDTVALPLAASAHAATWWWAVRRNTVGANGPLVWLGHERWVPAVPLPLSGALLVAALAVLAISPARASPGTARDRRAPGSAAGSTP